MTKKEIIEMAEKAGITISGEAIFRLCELVAEKEREKVTKERDMEQDCVGWFGYDTGLRLWFETNEGDDDAIPLYKRRRTHD